RRDHDNLDLKHLAAIGADAKQGIADALDRLHHFLQVKGRAERLDLRQQGIADALPSDVGNARNVIDRLLGIELRALATDLVENVDDVRLHVEETELKYRKEPAWSGPDDEHVALDGFCHEQQAS